MSRSLVYADPELKARITELRARRGGAGSASPPMPARSVVSERSLRNDLALARPTTATYETSWTSFAVDWAWQWPLD